MDEERGPGGLERLSLSMYVCVYVFIRAALYVRDAETQVGPNKRRLDRVFQRKQVGRNNTG